MPRYGQTTLAAQVSNIDVVEVAGRIVASASTKSAFMSIVSSQNGNRQRKYVQQGALSWAAGPTEATQPDESQYTPTAVDTTNTLHFVDAVLGQYALADAETSGKSLVDQVVDEGMVAYADYFDSECAALYSQVSTSPDHDLGSSTTVLSGPYIDQGIELLLQVGAPEPYALVIYTGKIRELMQIPGMREKAIRGPDGQGGVGGPEMGISSKQLVRGYANVLDVYHTNQIDIASSIRKNMMISVGDGVSNTSLVNPWNQMHGPNGKFPGKMHVDITWEEERRAVEVNMSTLEEHSSRTSTTSNDWMVVLGTS